MDGPYDPDGASRANGQSEPCRDLWLSRELHSHRMPVRGKEYMVHTGIQFLRSRQCRTSMSKDRFNSVSLERRLDLRGIEYRHDPVTGTHCMILPLRRPTNYEFNRRRWPYEEVVVTGCSATQLAVHIDARCIIGDSTPAGRILRDARIQERR